MYTAKLKVCKECLLHCAGPFPVCIRCGDNWFCPKIQEHKLDPKPDFGYESYKGTGKLKGKVQTCHNSFISYSTSDFQVQT